MMSKEKRRVPKLRFPGFTEDWEQRKFKDIAFKRGKISEADLPYVEFEDINSGIGTLNKNISQKVGHKKGLLFEAGDVLFGKLRPYLQNWLLCQFAGIAVGDFWVLQPQNVSSAFLYYLIQSEAYQSVANISSGTKMPRSSWPLVSETLFSIPKYKEANMIGEFFLLIDRTITLHQRKLNNLKLKKKALLQKLFPKNEERYPELRFPGFTDAWEQRKLNDFGIATGGTSIESEFVDGGTYKVINIGSYSEESVYNDQGLRVNKTDKTKSRILNKYDLTMILNDKTASGNIIGRVLLIDQDNTYVYNQRTERIEVDTKDFLPMFLYHMLNAPEQRKYIVKASQGNTQIYVNWSTISNIDYMIPQLLLEQEKIANLFSLINKDITLHQRKLDHLQLQKKALLQQMFV